MGHETKNRAKAMRIEGLQETLRDVKRITGEVNRLRIIRSALRSAVKVANVMEVARSYTPRGNRPHYSGRGGKKGGSALTQPGNLKKSVTMITSRSKEFPNIQVGYAAGKRAGKTGADGWYGLFVHEGYGMGSRTPNKAFDRATEATAGKVKAAFEIKLRAAVDRRVKKYGYGEGYGYW